MKVDYTGALSCSHYSAS